MPSNTTFDLENKCGSKLKFCNTAWGAVSMPLPRDEKENLFQQLSEKLRINCGQNLW